MKIIKTFYFRLFNIDFDLDVGLIGFGFKKFTFKKTSFTFIYDWILKLGYLAIVKHQTKNFEELKKISDIEWNKKFKKWEKEFR